jgi:hypothetical protein
MQKIETDYFIFSNDKIIEMDDEVKVEQYISKMTELQRKAYLIAKSHLGTSFNIKKSNGFVKR